MKRTMITILAILILAGLAGQVFADADADKDQKKIKSLEKRLQKLEIRSAKKWPGLLGLRAEYLEEPVGSGTPRARIHFPDGESLDSGDAVMAERLGEVLLVGQGDSIVVDPMPAIFDVLLRNRVAYRFVDGQTSAVFPVHPSVVLLSPEAGEAAKWYDAWPAQDLSEKNRVQLHRGMSMSVHRLL